MRKLWESQSPPFTSQAAWVCSCRRIRPRGSAGSLRRSCSPAGSAVSTVKVAAWLCRSRSTSLPVLAGQGELCHSCHPLHLLHGQIKCNTRHLPHIQTVCVPARLLVPLQASPQLLPPRLVSAGAQRSPTAAQGERSQHQLPVLSAGGSAAGRAMLIGPPGWQQPHRLASIGSIHSPGSPRPPPLGHPQPQAGLPLSHTCWCTFSNSCCCPARHRGLTAASAPLLQLVTSCWLCPPKEQSWEVKN